jgi:Tfp pilus assembly protein PilX
MRKSREKIKTRAYGIGLPLVLVILVIMCLLTLSVISVLTTKQNLKNEYASREAYQARCEAENAAEAWVAEAAQKLTDDPEGQPEQLTEEFEINARRKLVVELTKSEQDGVYNYDVTRWTTVTTEDTEVQTLQGM